MTSGASMFVTLNLCLFRAGGELSVWESFSKIFFEFPFEPHGFNYLPEQKYSRK